MLLRILALRLNIDPPFLFLTIVLSVRLERRSKKLNGMFETGGKPV
jgi:hypothetical protein